MWLTASAVAQEEGAVEAAPETVTIRGTTYWVVPDEKMRELGFEPFDIVDICYYDDRFVQVDVLFINLKYVKELNLEFYRDGFDASKWKRYIED